MPTISLQYAQTNATRPNPHFGHSLSLSWTSLPRARFSNIAYFLIRQYSQIASNFLGGILNSSIKLSKTTRHASSVHAFKTHTIRRYIDPLMLNSARKATFHVASLRTRLTISFDIFLRFAPPKE